MPESVITVENLSKRYIIGHQRSRDDGLRHVLNDAIRAPIAWLRANRERKRNAREEYWALKDVSFEIKQGEAVGIVGRNGAGKSTLLKVLSRITEPTTGRIEIAGRVASLLEVGTGFHQDLTGRENIFLNGAILGMSRVEIKRKFDEIVAFSEVERFLDTPVKRYSSGMYVRLAFAVAAHLEPEILIVDEVLAVGDAAFQKKCLGKMHEVASKERRTVLFVSHQIASITRLCSKAIWLDSGKIRQVGPAQLVCHSYLSDGSITGCKREWATPESAPGDEWIRLCAVEVTSDREQNGSFELDAPITIAATFLVLKGGKVLIPNAHIYGEDGTLIFISHDWYSGWREKPRAPGRFQTRFTIPGNFFNEGRVVVKMVATTYIPFEVHLDVPDVVGFQVVEPSGRDTARGDSAHFIPGVIRPMLQIETRSLS